MTSSLNDHVTRMMMDRSTVRIADGNSGWSPLGGAGAIFAVVMVLNVLSIQMVNSFFNEKKR